MRYVLGWAYKTGTFGPWAAGEVVELTDADAAHIQRDSPGILTVDVPKPTRTQVEVEHDRQIRSKGPRNRGVGA